MYANRIRLIATEAGVGVRALGDVAATAGDFTINAAGKIELAAKASAQHALRITSSGHQGITLHREAQIGRAACRERVCTCVLISVAYVTLQKNKQQNTS